MKFLSFLSDGEASFGAVQDDRIVDLGKRHADIADLRDAIRRGRLPDLAREASAPI